jgi:hypothetical protein
MALSHKRQAKNLSLGEEIAKFAPLVEKPCVYSEIRPDLHARIVAGVN